MSQIASFYVLPGNRVVDLIGAATPKQITTKSRSLGFIPVTKTERKDYFWDFLKANARKLDEFGFSGSVLCELDLFLSDTHAMLFDLAVKQPTEQLSSIRATSMALFDHVSAQKVLDMLSKVDCTPESIRRHCETEESYWSSDELIEPLRAAVAQTKLWMSGVGPADTGLLIVG
ncbi:MAG: hypothetical protein AAB263_07555 [Planctomycetota bacterium]